MVYTNAFTGIIISAIVLTAYTVKDSAESHVMDRRM